MRLLFDFQIFSLQPLGGVSRYFLELASRLAARTDVEIQIAAGFHRSLLLKETPARWIRGHYVRHWPKTLRLRWALNHLFARRQIRNWRPDVIHETYFRPGSSYQKATPTVITVYDLIYFILPSMIEGSDQARKEQRDAITRADQIICISESTRNDLLRFVCVEPERVSVIPLAGPVARVPNALVTWQPGLTGPFILYVGNRRGYKNFDVLLQAFAGLPHINSRYQLVAFGGDEFTQAESARIRTLGLHASRVIHRTGNDTLLGNYYAHADVFVYPSLYEGFGLPLLEAMTNGCPVICSNRGALPEVAAEAALYFDPADPGELARTLNAVASSPALAGSMRERGRRQAARFSWDRCADQTMRVYQGLTSRISASARRAAKSVD